MMTDRRHSPRGAEPQDVDDLIFSGQTDVPVSQR